MKCPRGAVKHRVAKPHGSHSSGSSISNYKHSMKGCTWKKLIRDNIHIGRYCENCGKKIFNPRCNL